jgi:signal transduction histidine kinase
MDEVVSLYSRRIQQKNLSVVREYAGGHAITALPGEVRQVLSNLVTNAIEASSMGGKLRLRIREACKWTGADSPKGLRITVADSGSGISDENRRRLGELFFTTKGQSGTGLGLWVTKSIVARYGGTLKLKSSTGRRHGTVFSLFLPFNSRIGAQDTQQNPASALVDQRTLGKRGNVMEISDHPSHHDNHTHHPANAHHLSVNGFTQKRNG